MPAKRRAPCGGTRRPERHAGERGAFPSRREGNRQLYAVERSELHVVPRRRCTTLLPHWHVSAATKKRFAPRQVRNRSRASSKSKPGLVRWLIGHLAHLAQHQQSLCSHGFRFVDFVDNARFILGVTAS